MKLETQMGGDSGNNLSLLDEPVLTTTGSIFPGPENYCLKRKNTNERPNVYT